MLPQITLETLGHCHVKSVLGITYITVILAIVLGAYEPYWKAQYLDFSGGACPMTSSFSSLGEIDGCFYYNATADEWGGDSGNATSVWQSSLKFKSQLSLYNAMSLRVIGHRNGTSGFPFLANFVNVTQIKIFGENGGDHKLLYNKQLGVSLDYQADQADTNPIWLVTRSGQYLNLIITYNQYSITWVEDFTDFRVQIIFQDCRLSDFVDTLSLQFRALNHEFVIASIITRVILQAVSIAFLIFWFCTIVQLEWKRVLPEHLWISGFLVAVLLNQDPFYGPMRWYPHMKWLWYLSTSGLLASQVLMMTFWMLMVNGMALPNTKHGYGFYMYKLVFGVTLLGVSLLVMVENDDQDKYARHERSIESGTFSDLASNYVLSIGFLVATVMFICWAIYILAWLCLTLHRLNGLPYVTTRFRQLSFRFFIYQSVFVVLYFIGTYIIILIEARGRVLQDTNTYNVDSGETIYRFQGWSGTTLSSTILLSFYCWLLSFVYLPSRFLIEHSKKKRQLRAAAGSRHNILSSRANSFAGGYIRLASSQNNTLESHCIRVGAFSTEKDSRALEGFSLQTATWLTYFADQAYFDTAQVPSSTLTYGQANLPRWFGFRISKVIRGPCDTHAYVAISHVLDSKAPVTRAQKPAWLHEDPEEEARRERRRAGEQLRDYPAIVIAFRGTVSFENVRTDLNMCSRADLEELKESFGFVMDQIKRNPKVHQGFWDAFKAIEPSMLQIVRQLDRHRQSLGLPPLRIYCTGHSLGGALSTILALSLRTKLGMDVEMYNFGSPRVGNHAFAQLYDKNVPKSFRVVMDGDVITNTPKLCCLYKHVGSEILLDTAGNFIINPAFVEKTFRQGRTSFKSHSLKVYLGALKQACAMMYPTTVTDPHNTMPVYRPLFTPKESMEGEDEGESGAFNFSVNSTGVSRKGSVNPADAKFETLSRDDLERMTAHSSNVQPLASPPAASSRGRPILPSPHSSADASTVNGERREKSRGSIEKPVPHAGPSAPFDIFNHEVKHSKQDAKRVRCGSRGEGEGGYAATEVDAEARRRTVLEAFAAPGPRFRIGPRPSRARISSDNHILHPKRTLEEKVPSFLGHVSVYTLPRPTKDESIDVKISLAPILVWNGSEYDVFLHNIPEHLDEFFDPRQLVRIGNGDADDGGEFT